jgi:hypothetical protein
MNEKMMQIKNVRFGSVLVVTTLLAFVLTSMELRAAEPIPNEREVSNAQAAEFLTECMFSDDAIDRSTPEGKYACCSKSLGFCVVCPASPTEKCTLHPHSISGENPLLQQVIVFDVLAPTLPSSEQTNPRTDSLNSLRNWLRRSTDEKESYESKGEQPSKVDNSSGIDARYL